MNELSVKQRQFDLLMATCRVYTLKNRCLDGHGCCKYTQPDKFGCAIGRLISKELCDIFDRGWIQAVSNDAVFYALPAELQELGQPFLGNLQTLHDKEENWTETGLSIEGSDFVHSMISFYNLQNLIVTQP